MGDERGNVAAAAAQEREGVPAPPAPKDEDHPKSFDPGIETGYLRRGARSYELDPEVGAAPFDPGPERYDSRRAKRVARRREKAERKRREKAERRQRERDEAALAERKERSREMRERLERAWEEQEAAAAADREQSSRDQLERERVEQQRMAELERAERQKQERELGRRAERERRERAEAEHRAEKDRARAELDAAEEKKRRERARERRVREQLEHKLAEGRKREREQKRRQPKRRRRQAEPQRAKPPPRRTPEATASLRGPTAKVGGALAGVAAVAVGVGVLLGLPLPVAGNSDASLAGAAPVPSLDPGTPTGLTKGPYHPVVISEPDYGESAAKFHADRGGRRHEGQDVFAKPGTPLVAVRDGIVLDGGGDKSFYSYGGGNTLVLYSPLDDRSFVYLHMLKPALVRSGERVKAGQLVGYVGCTGSCDGPHLHFEVRRGRAVFGPQKKAVDPLPLLRRWPVRPADQ